ncbi:MAG: beta-barrel assembly-enhancing protease [Rugosibacter sp.]|jgi:predicted Zn-dependent protease|nr:beta-barrel assembly-enhancing protease [Rugosibacter sp.]
MKGEFYGWPGQGEPSRYHSGMKPRLLSLQLFLACALSFSIPQPLRANGLPDLGDVAQADMSPALEKRIGEQVLNALRHDPSWLGDEEVNAYLNRLGNRLASHSEETRLTVSLFALRDSSLNAFAVPGGVIGVHTGLILAAESESELASVLAHEISHVTQHHQARMISKAGQGQIASIAALVVAVLAARSNPDLAMGAATAGQAVNIQNQLNYTRDFEREADRLGLDLLNRSGYDVRSMESFFERLQKYGRLYDNNTPGYLRTHPLTTERLADIGNRIQGLPYKQVADSLEFQLVRAKLRAQEGTAQDAVTYFSTQLKNKTYAGDPAAVHYGLSQSYLRAGNLAAAEKSLENIRQLKAESSLFLTLAADLRSKQNDAKGAVAILRAAYKRYPQERAVVYALIEALLTAGQPKEALKITQDDLFSHANDSLAHSLQAKTYAALGQRLQQHRAQAEAYALTGRLSEAIGQLELAQKAGDGSFYEQSQVDARLQEFRARREEEKKLIKGK